MHLQWVGKPKLRKILEPGWHHHPQRGAFGRFGLSDQHAEPLICRTHQITPTLHHLGVQMSFFRKREAADPRTVAQI